MRVLFVGGSGFIGSHLVNALLNEGYTVKIADVKKPFIPQHEKLWSYLDIRESNFNIRKYDVIYHLAHFRFGNKYYYDNLVSSKPFYEINVYGTYNLLRSMNPYALLIYTSSAGVYGNVENIFDPATEDSPLKACNPYAYSKIIGETLIKYSNRHYLIYRLSTIMGEYGYTFPNNLVYSAIHNQPIEVYNNGLATRNYLDIKDLIPALLTFREIPINQTYNVGSNKPIYNIHLVTLIEEIAKQYGYTLNYKCIKSTPPNYILYSSINNTKLKQHGWKPKTPLKQTINRLFQHYTKT